MSNKTRFLLKALILCSLGWHPLILYEGILNYISNRSILIRIFTFQVPNGKDCNDIFGYKMEILIWVEVFFEKL
jgi:hypothetical protein